MSYTASLKKRWTPEMHRKADRVLVTRMYDEGRISKQRLLDHLNYIENRKK